MVERPLIFLQAMLTRQRTELQRILADLETWESNSDAEEKAMTALKDALRKAIAGNEESYARLSPRHR